MLSEQIKALYEQREAKIKAMETLVESAESEAKTFSEEEQTQFDQYKTDIADLDKRIANLKETEQLVASTKAKPVVPEQQQRQPRIEVRHMPSSDLSLFYAKQAHALFMAGGSRSGASEYAKQTWGDEMLEKVLRLPASVVEKAAVDPGDSTTVGWAAELVQVYQAAEAFIELLRPMSVVARFPGRQMSFNGAGSIQIPRQSVGSNGTWVGENSAIKVDRLTLDQVTLTPKKNANIITATNELLMRSTPSALQIIRDDILSGVAQAIDTTFVSNDAEVAGVSPAGLQTFDGTPTVSTGATLDAITADLKTLLNAIVSVNMPMVRPLWLMNPTNVNALRFIRDGLGQYAYKDEIAQGTIVGYPYLESTTIPTDIVMLVDASQIVIASELAPVISLSEDASLHMEDTAPSDDLGGATTPVASMFQLDATAIRAKTTLDWDARYAECVQVLTTVAWNA